jgi:two-component system, OmpR family, sensor histidine kinase BaeS
MRPRRCQNVGFSRLPRTSVHLTLGITSKLFIAVLVTNVVTAFAVGIGVRAAFDSGFDSYLREREEARLTRLAGVLANQYRTNGSWDFLRGNAAMWVEINHSVRPPRPDAAKHAPAPPSGGWSPSEAPPPPRAIVIDTEGKTVVGDADRTQELKSRSISVNGKTVGFLAAPQRLTAFDVVDRRFQEEQWQAGWIVALWAIALAAIVSWLLSRGLIAPVKRLAGATRKLADGEYDTRVASTSTDEIGRLVDDFNRLGNALQKQETARRNFMADVSHELRTPIAVLKGELEAIEDKVRSLTPETLRSLQAEVARLASLVNDIHDLSLADVGGLAYRFEEVDLDALARDCLQPAGERLAANGLALELDIPGEAIRVRGDPERLRQLIGNLLENSLRYTDPGGRLRISLAREGAQAMLLWEDSEPGVPADSLSRIFERLFRLESSRSRERGGSGLGLSICQSVAQAHGGSIVARASALGGLAIEVKLPLWSGR